MDNLHEGTLARSGADAQSSADSGWHRDRHVLPSSVRAWLNRNCAWCTWIGAPTFGVVVGWLATWIH